MQRRLRSKLVYNSKDILLPLAQSIQFETLPPDQRRQLRSMHLNPEHMTRAELQDLKERIMEAIQSRRLHS
jgi:hypothetical protein